MILRIDALQTELPPPSEPDPVGASAVQELLGGKYGEIKAVLNGPQPETGDDLVVAKETHPEGAPAYDLPPQGAVFAPGPDPDMLADVSAKLRKAAGLPAKPTGAVANPNGSANGKSANTTAKGKAKSKAS